MSKIATATATDAPRIWAVVSHRAGENSQILALAESLEWGFETKRLAYGPAALMTGLLRRQSLDGIDRERSTPLEPPWPDLVISAGVRNEPACRWIREASGGRTKLVFLGRTWAALRHFDLVITTPQYRLPHRENVLHNVTTLHRVTRERLEEATGIWAPRFAGLPRPYIALLVGGNSGPYVFGPRAAARLAREASAMAERLGGSLLVTTSARTSAKAADALEANLSVPSFCYRWKPGMAENPFHGILALAESTIVTGDSIAMLSEALATGRPVHIFDLGTGAYAMHEREDGKGAGDRSDFRLQAFLYRHMMRLGPKRLSRDLRLVHEKVVRSGLASWLGEVPKPQRRTLPDAGRRAVARVRSVLVPQVPAAPVLSAPKIGAVKVGTAKMGIKVRPAELLAATEPAPRLAEGTVSA